MAVVRVEGPGTLMHLLFLERQGVQVCVGSEGDVWEHKSLYNLHDGVTLNVVEETGQQRDASVVKVLHHRNYRQ